MKTLLVSLLLAVPMPANYPSKPDYSADPSYVGECNFGPVFINGDRVRIGREGGPCYGVGRIEDGTVFVLWTMQYGTQTTFGIGIYDLDFDGFCGEWALLDSAYGGWLETICIRPNPER